MSGDGALSSPGGAGFTNLSQSAIIRWGWGFYTVSGGIDPKDYRFRPRFVGVVDVRNDLWSGDGTLILPGCRWLHEPQPVSDQSMGLGFPHRAGPYRPGESPFTSPCCRRCRCMQLNIVRGWGLILPRWRWLHEPQPISVKPVGLGCLLYTSPSPRDKRQSRMPSSA